MLTILIEFSLYQVKEGTLMKNTLTKSDLMSLGYGPSFSSDIVRQAKHLMVQQGYSYYASKRLGRVPTHAVESVLGYKIEPEYEQMRLSL